MITLNINGAAHRIDADNERPLLWVLRDDMQLTGTRYSCGAALCGACTVYVNGLPTRSCVTPASALADAKIVTIEALAADPVGKRVQQMWAELNVPQCGYCQSGQVMAATALLKAIPKPTDRDIDEAMSGNLCRCGMYPRIKAAIRKLSA